MSKEKIKQLLTVTPAGTYVAWYFFIACLCIGLKALIQLGIATYEGITAPNSGLGGLGALVYGPIAIVIVFVLLNIFLGLILLSIKMLFARKVAAAAIWIFVGPFLWIALLNAQLESLPVRDNALMYIPYILSITLVFVIYIDDFITSIIVDKAKKRKSIEDKSHGQISENTIQY